MTFQAKLTTKLTTYSIDDAIVELKKDVEKQQLDQIVKRVLKQLDKVDSLELEKKTFDFLLGGRLLQLSVDKHLELYSEELDTDEVLSEKLVEIEYILSLDPPEPLEAIPQDDWVSCIDANSTHVLTGSYDSSIKIYSILDRKIVANIQAAHDKPVTKVRWLRSDDHTNKKELFFISCGHDEVSKLNKFNIKTCKVQVIYIFKGHNRSVNCVDISDDLVATGSFDKTLRIWSSSITEDDNNHEDENSENGETKKKKQKTRSIEKYSSNENRTAMLTLTGHQESVTGVKWLTGCNEYSSLATCSMDRTLCIWDVEVGECKRRMLSAKPLLGLDFSSDSNLLITASCDKHIRIWDARAPDGATAKTAYTSHTAWVSSIAFGKSTNNFVSGGYDNLVKLWDIRSPKSCLYDMIGHRDIVLDVNWRNLSYVFSGSADATLKVFATK